MILNLSDTEQNCNDFWFGILTFLFIFLPTCNILGAFYGPSTAATFCSIWGDFLMIIGLCVWWFLSSAVHGAFLAWFSFLLGLGLLLLGSLGKGKNKITTCERIQLGKEVKERLPQLISFPIFILLSPLLNPLIRILNILMPKNKFIENQKKCAGIRYV